MRRLEDFFRTGGVISSGVGICRICRTDKNAQNFDLVHKRAVEQSQSPTSSQIVSTAADNRLARVLGTGAAARKRRASRPNLVYIQTIFPNMRGRE